MKKLNTVLPILFITIPLCIVGALIAFKNNAPYSQFDTLLQEAQDQKEVELLGHLPIDATATTDQEVKSAEDQESLLFPNELNHDVPFTTQAPLGNWSLPYQEACEEASLVMAVHFLLNKGPFTTQSADSEILDLVHFVEKEGYSIDTTAAETVEVAQKYFGESLYSELSNEVTVENIKGVLAKGGLVIMPFAGRQLPNPHFSAPGPLYHMLVVKGYTESGFITNDPGTKFGSNFTYSYEALLSANHDWNNGDVARGEKLMIILKKK